MLLVKGAPEVVLETCDRQQTGDRQLAPLDKGYFQQASDRLARRGERVVALAWLENPTLAPGTLTPADLPRNMVNPTAKTVTHHLTQSTSPELRFAMIM